MSFSYWGHNGDSREQFESYAHFSNRHSKLPQSSSIEPILVTFGAIGLLQVTSQAQVSSDWLSSSYFLQSSCFLPGQSFLPALQLGLIPLLCFFFSFIPVLDPAFRRREITNPTTVFMLPFSALDQFLIQFSDGERPPNQQPYLF